MHHIRTYSPSTRARMSAVDRRTQFRNRYLMIAKNDSARDLLRDAGPLLLYELLALGYSLLREPELLAGYLEAARRLPGALRHRRVIQSRRRVRRVPFGLEASMTASVASTTQEGRGRGKTWRASAWWPHQVSTIRYVECVAAPPAAVPCGSPATACPSVMGGSARSYYVERPVDGSPESG